jgi:hypothetical protein
MFFVVLECTSFYLKTVIYQPSTKINKKALCAPDSFNLEKLLRYLVDMETLAPRNFRTYLFLPLRKATFRNQFRGFVTI